MIDITLKEAAQAVSGKLVCNKDMENSVISGISLDSRKIKPGWLFIALKGEKADGFDFTDAAFRNGAVCALCERPAEKHPHILVESSFEALKKLGAYIRSKSRAKFIAVVGSVGKTGTRRMLECMLSQKFRTHSTEGNFNNEYGLPQTLFNLKKTDEVSVLELGISNFGEMSELGKIARPDYALYTNIGDMHLENLKNREGVLKAKTELIDYMPETGRLFFNGADKMLRRFDSPLPVTYYGTDESYFIHPSDIEQIGNESTVFTLHIGSESIRVNMPAVGAHMVLNAVAAANVAYFLSLTIEEIKNGIESFSPVGHRWRILHKNGFTVIDDCYNAGPNSMRAALSALNSDSDGRKIAVLGDMLELGETSGRLHYELGTFCSQAGLDALFTVGNEAKSIARGARDAGMKQVFELSYDKAAEKLKAYLKTGDVLLVKASRGMKFENIIDGIIE